MTLSRTQNKVELRNKLSGSFSYHTRNFLSTQLLKTGLGKVTRNAKINARDAIFHRTKQLVAYAHDVPTADRTVEAITAVLTQDQTAAVSSGLV
jgi:hypothetical protein